MAPARLLRAGCGNGAERPCRPLRDHPAPLPAHGAARTAEWPSGGAAGRGWGGKRFLGGVHGPRPRSPRGIFPQLSRNPDTAPSCSFPALSPCSPCAGAIEVAGVPRSVAFSIAGGSVWSRGRVWTEVRRSPLRVLTLPRKRPRNARCPRGC